MQFVGRDRRRKRTGKHQSLESDIDDTGPFGEHSAECGKDQRRRQP